MSLIGAFASWPRVHYFPQGDAQIKMSFAHGSQRKSACRKLSSEEIAKLPAKERRPNTCDRERLPIRVQLALDGKTLYDETLQPTGLSRDGPARLYRKFVVQSGSHNLIIRLRDSDRVEGFDHEQSVDVALRPLQNLVVEFKGDEGMFHIH
ncbi:MAG: hypothetical protein EKK41_09860 [Hyphomicrobiales bacterium]|nr:MAG: hypothetical protein EKK41_09860 [Hyphomicrobiales bacterium]